MSMVRHAISHIMPDCVTDLHSARRTNLSKLRKVTIPLQASGGMTHFFFEDESQRLVLRPEFPA